jgi:outer membrane protein OmpA-like peptidoglycan-associated protein
MGIRPVISVIAGLALMVPGVAAGEPLISPFEGSEPIGNFEARYAELPLLVPPLGDRAIPATTVVEGAVTSHIYRRPEGVDPFEVYASYRAALEGGGFDILLDCRAPDCNLKLGVGPVYRDAMGARAYSRMPTSTRVYLTGWVEHYISARKQLDDRTYHAAILISRERGFYSVDVVESAERRADTVTLSEALLTSRIEDEGKSVLDGIHFETGNDSIRPESAAAMDVITAYLRNNEDTSFYVVGHTDDTGELQANLALSKARATAVAKALTERGIDPTRLAAAGVGPWSPVASNQTQAGKAANRRVELVLSP